MLWSACPLKGSPVSGQYPHVLSAVWRQPISLYHNIKPQSDTRKITVCYKGKNEYLSPFTSGFYPLLWSCWYLCGMIGQKMISVSPEIACARENPCCGSFRVWRGRLRRWPRRRFSRAVFSHQSVDFSGLYLQLDMVQRFYTRKCLTDVFHFQNIVHTTLLCRSASFIVRPCCQSMEKFVWLSFFGFSVIILANTIFSSNGVFSLQGGQFSDVFNQQRDMLYWIRINWIHITAAYPGRDKIYEKNDYCSNRNRCDCGNCHHDHFHSGKIWVTWQGRDSGKSWAVCKQSWYCGWDLEILMKKGLLREP